MGSSSDDESLLSFVLAFLVVGVGCNCGCYCSVDVDTSLAVLVVLKKLLRPLVVLFNEANVLNPENENILF